MNIVEKLKSSLTYFDGGFGSMLIERGLAPGENSTLWNLTHPQTVLDIHREYINAGVDIITANTFGANPLKAINYAECIKSGLDIANKAALECSDRKIYVALDIGPLGRLLKPLGDLEFEEAVSHFANIINAAKESSCDFILFETFSDSLETKAAVIAAKENSNLPIFVSNSYDESSRMLTGTTPEAMCAMLEGMSVDAVGMNCSVGPAQMLKTAKRLIEATSLPVFACPNAGFPHEEKGTTVYDVGEDEFSDIMRDFVRIGVNAVGGCCGTTPTYMRKVIEKSRNILPVARRPVSERTVISSWANALYIGEKPLLIGERINPTGKPKLKEALRRSDFEYILKEAIAEQDAGAHILDINVGLPEVDEVSLMSEAVTRIQAISSLPLQLDTVNPEALENALRIYNGKPLINSVNGKDESMEKVFPLAAKYGGAIIALTIDENGIPSSARERADIARKIIDKAAEFNISKKDIIVDPLALAVSSDINSAKITLDSIKIIKEELGVCVSLGVSNISFGLPQRDFVNGSFFAMALDRGLDLAIINPLSFEMQKVYNTFLMLNSMDEGCVNYINFASNIKAPEAATAALLEIGAMSDKKPISLNEGLKKYIVEGISKAAAECAERLMEIVDPMEVINREVIPALEYVGGEFEKKRMYLPQLLMSADAAKVAFEVLKKKIPAGNAEKGKIILATVRGDLHDIGKNIVKTVLQSYGYFVIDLGKDVKPEAVLEAAITNNVNFVGLSALMTTTVPSMKDTITLLKANIPDIFTVVGGAVVNEECAKMVGADAYSADAMATVRIADKYFGN